MKRIVIELSVIIGLIAMGLPVMILGTEGPPVTSNKIDFSSSVRSKATSPLDIATLDGRVYSNCAITRVEPDGITFSFTDGVAKIVFPDLSDAYRKKYDYNPTNAAKYIRMVQQRAAAALANQPEPTRPYPESGEYEADNKAALDEIRSTAIDVYGIVQQITNDGAVIKEAITPTPYQEEVVEEGYKPAERNRRFTTKLGLAPVTPDGEPIFIFGGGIGFAPGDDWDATVYPAGSFTYTTLDGIEKTAKCYALSPESALNKLRAENK